MGLLPLVRPRLAPLAQNPLNVLTLCAQAATAEESSSTGQLQAVQDMAAELQGAGKRSAAERVHQQLGTFQGDDMPTVREAEHEIERLAMQRGTAGEQHELQGLMQQMLEVVVGMVHAITHQQSVMLSTPHGLGSLQWWMMSQHTITRRVLAGTVEICG